MKKRGFSLIVIVSGILGAKSASAAEDIIIGGKPYPLLIIGPVIIVAGAWVILSIMWLSRNRHSIALVFYNSGRLFEMLGARIGINRLKEKVEERRRRKEETEKAKRAALLSGTKIMPKAEKEETGKKDLTPYIERVEAIEAQLPRFNEAIVFKNLTATVRSFFAALLNLNYEFTEQELIEQLEQKKKGLVGFAMKLSDIKYSGQELTKADLLQLTDDFKKIIEHYVKAGWSKKRAAKGSVEKLVEEDKKILANIRGYLDFLKNESRKRQIEKLLADETKVLSRNIRLIKRKYNRILAYYVQLTPDEKAAVYPQLIAFYKNINTALFSTVYSAKSKKELEYFAAELARMKKRPAKMPFLIRVKRAFRAKETPQEILAGTEKRMPMKARLRKTEEGKMPALPEEEREPLMQKVGRLLGKKEEPEEKKPMKPGRKEKVIIRTAEAATPLPSMQPLVEKLKRALRLSEVPTKEIDIKLEEMPPEVPIVPAEMRKLKKAVQKAKEALPVKAEARKPEQKIAMPKEPSEAIEAIGKILGAATIEKVDYMQKLKGLLSQGWFEITSKNIGSAEKAYNDILLCYSSLSKAEQKQVYRQVTNLFNAIKAERDKLLEAEMKERQRAAAKLRMEEAKRKKAEEEAERRRKIEENKALLAEKRRLEAEQRKLAEAESKIKLQESLAKAAATRFVNKLEEMITKKEAEKRKKIEESRARQLKEMSEKWKLGKALEKGAASYDEKKIADALNTPEMRALEAEKTMYEAKLKEMEKKSAEEHKRMDEEMKRQKTLEEKMRNEEGAKRKKEEVKKKEEKKATEALSKLEAEELKLMAELEMLKRRL